MHYNWLSVLFAISVVPLANLATYPAALWGDIRVKHSWKTIPANWESLGPPPAGTTVDLYIALKPHRENALIDALYEISDPGHQKHVVFTTHLLALLLTCATDLLRYGSHLSQEQVAELVAPHQDTLELVRTWLKRHGVLPSSISRSHGGGWLTISAVPVSQADELLCASYQIYKPTVTNGTEGILRTISYGLPEILHKHIRMVAPTTLFISPRTQLHPVTLRKRSSEEAEVMVNATSDELGRVLSRHTQPHEPLIGVTPSAVRWLYKTENYVPKAAGRNAIGILGLENELPSPSDLKRFMTEYRADAISATYTVVPVNGGKYDTNPSCPGSEASVDIQYCNVMAYPTPQYFYSTGGLLQWSALDGLPTQKDPYLVWLNYLLELRHIPPTITISYANPESMFPPEYATEICDLFAQLGVRGISVVVSSGDKGVGDGDCLDASGNVQFAPMFPPSCPYVTSVGGTMDYPEKAMPLSGGGFSRYFPREEYQDAAVTTYLKYLGIKYTGFYNPYGRGIPDISSSGHQLAIVVDGLFYAVTGTSASTPVVAGIVSLLNDYLISTGRHPLGFLNLWLYGRGHAGLNDITSGNNPGCRTEGFNAIAGWDPVTGLGSLDFPSLQGVLDSSRELNDDGPG
ncbi:subtilisin-like protein [Lactarius quietus]|nr:subtilisin-like protein [Lactarius quietus]